MRTRRAKVTFVVKESETGPFISVEQLGGDAVLPNNEFFGLDLGPNVTLDEAKEIAAQLRETIKAITRTG